MTREEGAATDAIARGESVPGGPGACARAGCAHGQVWHSTSNRRHPCERCDCPAYVRTIVAELPALDEADQPALDGMEPPAEPEQLTLDTAGTLDQAALNEAAAGVIAAALVLVPDDRELLEAASAAWLAQEPDVTSPLELLDSGTIGLVGFWFTIDSRCVCHSCGGQCGGCGNPGWCGRVALIDGRPVCEVCREQADVFDTHRVGISARIVDGEHIALVTDPFETYRKVTARLSPREARHLAELLNTRAAELEIEIAGSPA